MTPTKPAAPSSRDGVAGRDSVAFWVTLTAAAAVCASATVPWADGAVSAVTVLVLAAIATWALVSGRTVEALVLLGAYYLVRFPLVATWPPSTYVGDWFSFLALALVAVGVIRGGMRARWFDWVALGLGVWLLGWAILGPPHVPATPALVQLRAMFGLYPVYIYFRETGFPDFPRLSGQVRVYTLVTVAAVALTAAFEKISHKAVGAAASVRVDALSGGLGPNNFPRVYGLTGNPNTLGAVCVLVAVLVLVLLARRALSRGEAWLAGGALMMTILLTVSRSAALAWLTVLAAVLVFGGLGPRLPRWSAVRTLGISALIGLALAVPVTALSLAIPAPAVSRGTGDDLLVFTRFFVGGEEVGRSVQEGRLYTMRTAARVVAADPGVAATGSGLGTFGGAGSQFWRPPLYDRFGISSGFNSDLMYGTLLIETGLPGMIVLALIVVMLVRAGPGPRAVRWGLLAVFAIWGLFYNVFEMHAVFFLWTLAAGTALTYVPREAAADAPGGEGR